MGDSVEQNIKKRQLLRQTIECLARPLDGEAREGFLVEAERIMNTSNPPPSAASKRKTFRVV
jgi:hypothetical protein